MPEPVVCQTLRDIKIKAAALKASCDAYYEARGCPEQSPMDEICQKLQGASHACGVLIDVMADEMLEQGCDTA